MPDAQQASSFAANEGVRVQSAREALEHIAGGRASFPREYAQVALEKLDEFPVIVHDMLGKPQHLHGDTTYHVSFTGHCPGCD